MSWRASEIAEIELILATSAARSRLARAPRIRVNDRRTYPRWPPTAASTGPPRRVLHHRTSWTRSAHGVMSCARPATTRARSASCSISPCRPRTDRPTRDSSVWRGFGPRLPTPPRACARSCGPSRAKRVMVRLAVRPEPGAPGYYTGPIFEVSTAPASSAIAGAADTIGWSADCSATIPAASRSGSKGVDPRGARGEPGRRA